MSLESKVKTMAELMQKRKQWLEDFKNGALGNQEAYARARDNRPEFEFNAKWVPLEEAQKLETIIETAKRVLYYFPRDCPEIAYDWLEDMKAALNANEKTKEEK